MKSLHGLSIIVLSIASSIAIAPASHAGEVNVACTNTKGNTTYTSFYVPYVNVPALNVASASPNPNYCKVRTGFTSPVRVNTYQVRVKETDYPATVNIVEVPVVAPVYTIQVTPVQPLW